MDYSHFFPFGFFRSLFCSHAIYISCFLVCQRCPLSIASQSSKLFVHTVISKSTGDITLPSLSNASFSLYFALSRYRPLLSRPLTSSTSTSLWLLWKKKSLYTHNLPCIKTLARSLVAKTIKLFGWY